MIALGPLGDRAFLARFASEAEAAGWAGALGALGLPGVVEVTLAYATVAIFVDPDRVDLEVLETRVRSLEPAAIGRPIGRTITIPVFYDGPDLAEVARMTGISVAGVIAAHASAPYPVFAVGYLPGFPYAGYLPHPLEAVPRRAEPRPWVPAGSVAIAARQTGIYPTDSPGGWNLLGRTPLRIVEPAAGHFPIRPGDSLRFEPIGEGAFQALQGRMLPGPTDPGPGRP